MASTGAIQSGSTVPTDTGSAEAPAEPAPEPAATNPGLALNPYDFVNQQSDSSAWTWSAQNSSTSSRLNAVRPNMFETEAAEDPAAGTTSAAQATVTATSANKDFKPIATKNELKYT